jgi:hypothetical protein
MSTLGIPIIIGITLGFLGVLLETILDNLSWLWQGVLLYLGGFLLCTNPFATVVATKLIEEAENTLFFFTVNISGSGVSFNAPLISPWIVYTLFYTAVSAALILASVLVIRWKRG